MSFVIDMWKGLSKREKQLFLIGIFIGIMAMAPLILINDRIPTPTAYDITAVENSIDYNAYYVKYCGEVGNYTFGDRLIILTPAFDGNDYSNIAVSPLSLKEGINWRYICIINSDGNMVEKQKTPESGETYTFENIENLHSVAIFLYAETPIYDIELWVW